LVAGRGPRRKRSEYVRWERPAAMQLWQIGIVGGPLLVDTATGELREARIVTGVDDHSRFCVIARAVERATGRAVCLAFAAALERHGAPEEVLTDNGKQFTDRCGRAASCSSTGSAAATGSRTGLPSQARRPRPGRSSGCIRRCGASWSPMRARSSRCWRRRPRSMTGRASTTRPGHIRRSRLARRSLPRSAFRPPATSRASCCRCGCPARWPPRPSGRSRRPSSERSTPAPPLRSSMAGRSSSIA
jgi:hypothetical protein